MRNLLVVAVLVGWVFSETPFDSHGLIAGEPATEGLPLVEVGAPGGPRADTSGGDALAIFLSGDGGWTTLDRRIAADLSAAGLPVVGLNSFRYFFFRAREPEQVAADLTRILEHYLGAWHKSAAVLIGYSRGADVLPIALNRMKPSALSRVRAVVLLGASPRSDLELHLWDFASDLFHRCTGSRDTVAEARRLSGVRLVCVYGRRERHSLCRHLASSELVELKPMRGGHHFAGDYRAVAASILAAERAARARLPQQAAEADGPPAAAAPDPRARRP